MLGSANRKRMLGFTALGIFLTILTAVWDRFDWPGKTWLESLLYDSRLYYCQHFRLNPPTGHPPTDKIVHLDIDDGALEVIGRWPWPRQRIAQVVDEINNANAKVLFMDILLTDVERDNEGHEVKGGDDALAASIKRFGRVVVPMSVKAADGDEFSPIARRVIAELMTDPEMTQGELLMKVQALVKSGEDQALPRDPRGLAMAVNTRFADARKEALYNRCAALLDQGVTDFALVRKAVLPRTNPLMSTTPLTDILRDQFLRAVKEREIRRFKLPIPRNIPPLVNARYDTEQVPLPAFADAGAFSGFVDPFSVGDRKLRSVVLGMQSRGQMLPHASLALTCALLGADIQSVSFTESEVTIPLPDGTKKVVPVRTAANDAGRPVPLVMDIPWWGPKSWEHMYDFPGFQRPVQHESMILVGEVLRSRDIIRANETMFDNALHDLLLDLDPNKLAEYEKNKPTGPALDKLVAEALEFADLNITGYREIPEAQRKPDEVEKLRNIEFCKQSLQACPKAIATARTDLQNQLANLRNKLADKAVMIGWTATAAFDFYPTSLHDRCPGVVALGAVVNGIVTDHTWSHLPAWPTTLVTLIVGLSTTALVVALTPIRAALFTTVLAAGYFLGNGFLVFDYGGKVLGAAGPAVAMGSVAVIVSVVRFAVEIAERNRITARFRSYVDPKLVEFVVNNPNSDAMAGSVNEMTVVFTDLEGFTTLSEALKEKTVPMLSDYMGRMVPLIRSHNGYVNKFLGDGIMFFFNAPVHPDPDHAADAVKAILDMQRAMAPFNEELKAKGLPTLNMRAGITTGEMVIGDAGPKNAADYTVLGDNVNLAARLESANKATGTNTMILWRTKDLLGDRFLCRPIARLQVKGKTEGVMTYEPLGPADMATPEQRRLVELSTAVVEAYFNAEFLACAEACDAMDNELGPSKFTKLYRKEASLRAEEFATPGFDPTSFQGVITLSEK